MLFNKDALSYKKLEKKYNSDEMFAIGYIIGMQDAFSTIIEKTNPEINEEKIEQEVNNIMRYAEIEELWTSVGFKLELDLRPLHELDLFDNIE